MIYPKSIATLIEQFQKFPSVGPKSAQRMAFQVLKMPVSEVEKFAKGDIAFVNASKDAYNAMAKFHSASSFITDIFNVIILIAGGLFLYAGKISFGDYSTFIVSVNLFINPITTLIGFMEQFQNGASGFKRFVEIMDEVPEKENAEAEKLENVEGTIEFKNVTFGYNENQIISYNDKN